MRSWIKWTGAGVFGLCATTAIAADHRDGPAVKADPAADIADVYAWTVENNTKLALIQTIVGEFSPTVQYVLHVGRTATDAEALVVGPTAWTNIICEFANPTSAQCWVDDGSGTPVDYLTGDPSTDMGLTGQNGTVRVHAAEHGDPFFFYLDGFNAARVEVQQLIAANSPIVADVAPMDGCPDALNTVITQGGCQTTLESNASLLRGLLTGEFADDTCAAGTPINNFETGNVFAIVAEVDKTAIGGTGEFFTVYASTHAKE